MSGILTVGMNNISDKFDKAGCILFKEWITRQSTLFNVSDTVFFSLFSLIIPLLLFTYPFMCPLCPCPICPCPCPPCPFPQCLCPRFPGNLIPRIYLFASGAVFAYLCLVAYKVW